MIKQYQISVDLFPENRQSSKGAILSQCGKYRYRLWRIWQNDKPKVLFVMHNPSTADANDDAPTIRRCIAFAKSWGYGGIFVGNLSPYRATDPSELNAVPYNELLDFDQNIKHMFSMLHECKLYVLAHGVPNKQLISLADQRMGFIHQQFHYLKMTKDRYPCHPLFLPKDLTPIAF